jgi:hypothetical protein
MHDNYYDDPSAMTTESTTKPRSIIEIYPNGDPYGRGFQGSQSDDNGHSWYFRGDVSPAPRWWWRNYARRNNAILRHRY